MNRAARLEALTLREGDRFWDMVLETDLDVDITDRRIALVHSDGCVIVETPATGDIGLDLRVLLCRLAARAALPQLGGEA